MRKSHYSTLLLILIIFGGEQIWAQSKYPQGQFINPLNIPIQLAGSFAECRPNHFHTGIDLKTNNKENYRVAAAADGYISRISISHSGYGNCLYMTHPNGYTSVYGHLNNFVPELMAYVKEQQYAQQKWNVDLILPVDSFHFSQGQQIAFSGNTGGSTAPHLHFEIRDTKTEEVFNPLLFGLPIKDNIAPKATQLAYYDATAYYESKPIFSNLGAPQKNEYHPAILNVPYPKAFVGVDVQDFVNGSSNWLGIKQMQLFVDDVLVTDVLIEGLFFNQSRAVNAYADYGTNRKRGKWFQGLYRLPNNPLQVYQLAKNDGTIDLSDGQFHEVKIVLKDAMNNSSVIKQNVKYNGKAVNNKACSARINFGKAYHYQNLSRNASLKTEPNSFYDNICLALSEKLNPNGMSGIFEVGDPNIPVHDFMELRIKLYKDLPETLKSKLVFVHKIPNAKLPGANSQDAQKATFEGGFALAKIRSFGQYYVSLDTLAPKISKVNSSKPKEIKFKLSENLTSIKKYDVYINGKWTCFSRVGNIISYQLSDADPKGLLNINVKAMDDNDNEASEVFKMNN